MQAWAHTFSASMMLERWSRRSTKATPSTFLACLRRYLSRYSLTYCALKCFVSSTPLANAHRLKGLEIHLPIPAEGLVRVSALRSSFVWFGAGTIH